MVPPRMPQTIGLAQTTVSTEMPMAINSCARGKTERLKPMTYQIA